MLYPKILRTLGWLGGKQAQNKNLFVANMLPWHLDTSYCEPFAGMLSVLLAREKVKTEIVGDRNGYIVNWWRCLQSQPDALAHLLRHTPYAEAEYDKACGILFGDDTADQLWTAWAFYAYLRMSQIPSGKRTGFLLQMDPGRGRGMWRDQEVARLNERIRDMEIVEMDAVRLLERVAERDYMVIYCDPPYAESKTGGQDYAVSVDYDELGEMLSRQQGRVAISGYGQEWDHLGWERYEYPVSISSFSSRGDSRKGERIEVLWCNYNARKEASAYWAALAIADKGMDRQLKRKANHSPQ